MRMTGGSLVTEALVDFGLDDFGLGDFGLGDKIWPGSSESGDGPFITSFFPSSTGAWTGFTDWRAFVFFFVVGIECAKLPLFF